MASPDFEALVSPRIKGAIEAAIEKLGRKDFLEIAEISNQELLSLLTDNDAYVNVSLVTLACEINKNHGDTEPAHSSITECLKGTAIRIPQAPAAASSVSKSSRRSLPIIRSSRTPIRGGPLYDRKSYKLLGFSANTLVFLILGYFFGGLVLSPILGQPTCTGVSVTPPGVSPCAGSVVGIIVSAIVGLAYTYYYFVKKM